MRCSVRPISHYAKYIAHPFGLPPVWVVIPQPYKPFDPTDVAPVWGLGRRELWLPKGSAICATRREAMNYATTGARFQPVANVYPEWCGV